ncbi:unnamed protein product [Cylicostephanus goldi]|uniref:Uncharacterized protein n=1 Tax=Cylicostephanus goldi TaxID=71465 RepID=A0A3P6UKF8_CYLGO|nr:unnamed protein product [Cylicostephanus goldi]
MVEKIHRHLRTRPNLQDRHAYWSDRVILTKFGRTPVNFRQILNASNVIRLNILLEILLGKRPNYRSQSTNSCLSDVLGIAESAFDGANGRLLEEFGTMMILPRTNANRWFCYCRLCPVGTTLLNHVYNRTNQLPEDMTLPVIRIGMGNEVRYLMIEQIWVQVPLHLFYEKEEDYPAPRQPRFHPRSLWSCSSSDETDDDYSEGTESSN